jgi:hypothetical protein
MRALFWLDTGARLTALFRNMRALFWIRLTAGSARLLRKSWFTHAGLPWVRAEEPNRSQEFCNFHVVAEPRASPARRDTVTLGTRPHAL